MRTVRISSSVIWNLSLLFFIFLLTGFIFVGAVGAGYFASLVKEEPLRSKKEMREQIFSYEETSELYFADDIYIGKIRTDLDRRETTLANISPYAIDAVLATEDEYFREHYGIVPKAIIRGLLQDVANSATQTGGSTLTQQLIKNQILTNEVSYERKAKELLLAMRIEKFMTKDEILEAYLNIIPYGRNASGRNIAGIETAAEGIFGVSAKDLTLPQAAYIAGIPQAPFAYTPFTAKTGELKSPELLQKGVNRMKTVLYRMKEVGYITEAEYKTASAYDIIQDFKKSEVAATSTYPWLMAELENRAKEILAEVLAKKDGIEPERLTEEENLKEKYLILANRDLRAGGYRIYSTINKGMYDAMQTTAQNFKYYGHTFTATEIDPTTGKPVEVQIPVQVGSVMIENSTGRILSFVGGRDFEIEEFNHATQSNRQIGSTMKPLLVYAPAIEFGMIGAGSPVVDVKLNVPGYNPSNYLESQELGIIPAREALASSQNLAAIRLYNTVRNQNPGQFIEKMKINSIPKEEYAQLSTAIGSHETTVERNTNAYATFANGGKFIESYMIEKIEDVDGHVVYQHKVEPVDVYSEQTAYIMTDMLRDVLTTSTGTGRKAKSMLKFSGDFAAKTGTTNNYKDVWFVGYNKNISLGVWLGYEDNRSLYQFNSTYLQPGARVNMLWASLMNSAYDANQVLVGTKERFSRPKGVITASFCGISGLAPSSACAKAGLIRSDLFNAQKFVPRKPDDSLISTSGVTVNGKVYKALPSTPKEFITGNGIGLNSEFIKRMLGNLGGNPANLLPKQSSLANSVVTGAEFKADSQAPTAVTATLTGNTLTWTKSASKDVVGYRVYRVDQGNKLMASILEASPYRTVVTNGSYVVVAVDITGRTSQLSNIATIENKEKEPPKEEAEPIDTVPPTSEMPDENDSGNSDATNNETDNGSNLEDIQNQNSIN